MSCAVPARGSTKPAAAHLGRPLAVGAPGPGGVDRLAVAPQVGADGGQQVLLRLRDRALGPRARCSAACCRSCSPGRPARGRAPPRCSRRSRWCRTPRVADGVVGQPAGAAQVGGAAAFVVEHRALQVEAVLGGDDDLFAPRVGLVVVVGQEVEPLGLLDEVQAAVLPDHVRLVLVDDLLQLVEPELLFGGVAELPVQLLPAAPTRRGRTRRPGT